MKVLVTFAVDAEFAPWRKLRKFVWVNRDGVECFSAWEGDTEIRVLLSGIGCRNAGWSPALKVWGGDIDVCVSSGLAGGLRAEHLVGEVLVAKEILGMGTERVSCDPGLVQRAVVSGAKKVESFFTGELVVLRAEEKKQLGAKADAVEMETLTILREAVAARARVVAVRGVSDSVEEDLPMDFNRVTATDGSVSMVKVLGQVARRPGAIPALVKFGKQSRMAAEKLAEFLEEFVARMPEKDRVE